MLAPYTFAPRAQQHLLPFNGFHPPLTPLILYSSFPVSGVGPCALGFGAAVATVDSQSVYISAGTGDALVAVVTSLLVLRRIACVRRMESDNTQTQLLHIQYMYTYTPFCPKRWPIPDGAFYRTYCCYVMLGNESVCGTVCMCVCLCT